MTASLAYPLADAAPAPLTVAVTSGKGGVGKSQLIASLAVILSQEGKKPLVVDADVGCGDLEVLMDVRPPVDLREVLRGARRPEEAVATATFGDLRIDLLPSPSADRNGSELSSGEQLGIVDAIERVGWSYNTVLVDTGAGVSRNPMLFAAAADRVLVVTTAEPTAIQDAYAAIKVLHQAHRILRFELVVNQALNMREGKAVYARLASVVARFLPVELGLLGVLPTDPRVGRAVKARQPAAFAYPSSPYAHAVRGVARRLFEGERARPGGQLRYFAASSRPSDDGSPAVEALASGDGR